MAMLRTLVCLAMLVQLAMAETHTVGGANGGWDSSTDVETWVASQKFSVGDILLFQYTPNHDVLEVSKADYDSCQTGSPLKTYSDGNTLVPLTAPGKRYFICGTLGHCSQGMKIEINTLATAPSIPPLGSPASKTSPPPAAGPGSPSSPAVPSTQPPESETSPSATPSVSPAPSTTNPPELAPVSPSPADVTSMESPESASSPSGPPPSPANRNRFQRCLTFGFGLLLVALLSL